MCILHASSDTLQFMFLLGLRRCQRSLCWRYNRIHVMFSLTCRPQAMSAKSLLEIQQDTCYVFSHLQASGDVSEVPAGDTTGAGETAGEGETET